MNKNLLKVSTALLSFSMVIGCSAIDSEEPDLDEEPSEQTEEIEEGQNE
ncbi:hypothetical protein [Alkalihalobacillus deserti]|nr:hypothetical protein [Alkalihalobacillus deserti]